MGDQQNPDGIYVPPGVNRRYPLENCQCGIETVENKSYTGKVLSKSYNRIYNPECMIHGQIGIT